ncbi:MAG: hypothetical protein INQ03_16165 [Candidatus Heimdallarchaeota archaeon]|nr:hypothetical protein [Candidatus Heimdallarchaeota archaeon]
MYIQESSGTYSKMGRENGIEYIKQLHKFQADNKLVDFPKSITTSQLKLARQFEKQMDEFCPDVLEELKAFSKGANQEHLSHLAQECTPIRLQTQCMIIAISGEHTSDGSPLLLKNQEWLETDGEFLTIATSRPKDKISSIGVSFFSANTSRYGGVNKEGLAITSVSTSFEYKDPGIMFNIAIQWILDNCSTTNEAVNFLEIIPRVWGCVYIIIDKYGTIAKVESHWSKIKVTYSQTGFEIVTFRYDSEDMAILNEFDNTLEMYEARCSFVNKWFQKNKGSITPEMLMIVSKAHEATICYHDEQDGMFYGTAWSYVIPLSKPYFFISEGPPCKNEFQRIEYSF